MPIDYKEVYSNKLIRGFTLPELLVSIAIIGFLASSVAFSYRSSNDSFVVNSAAQELAIEIRQAQSYGLSVKESGAGTGSFSNAYGIYAYPELDDTSYYLFIDRNNNQFYDAGSGSCGTLTTECVEKITLRNKVTIDQVCVIPGSSTNCAGPHNGSLSFTFLRPNPDADVNFFNAGGMRIIPHSANGRIKLISPLGKIINITVYSTGQISVVAD
jgi:prepilin-type N-terminal cleavage/methylation domain-containing protein